MAGKRINSRIKRQPEKESGTSDTTKLTEFSGPSFVTRDEFKDMKDDLRREMWLPWKIVIFVIAFVSFAGWLAVSKFAWNMYKDWHKKRTVEIINEVRPMPTIINKPLDNTKK